MFGPQCIDFLQQLCGRKSPGLPRTQPCEHIGTAQHRRPRFETRHGRALRQSHHERMQSIPRPRLTFGIEGHDPRTRQRSLRERQHFRIRNANTEHAFRSGVAPRRRHQILRLCRRIGADPHPLLKAAQRDQSPLPPRHHRPSPAIEVFRLLCRRIHHHVHPHSLPCVRRQRTQRQGQRIGRSQHHNFLHSRRQNRIAGRRDPYRLFVAPPHPRQFFVVAPLQRAELTPALRLGTFRAYPSHDVRHPQASLAQRHLQPPKFRAERERPSRIALRWIDRKHVPAIGQIHFLHYVHPSEQRLDPRRRPRR